MVPHLPQEAAALTVEVEPITGVLLPRTMEVQAGVPEVTNPLAGLLHEAAATVDLPAVVVPEVTEAQEVVPGALEATEVLEAVLEALEATGVLVVVPEAPEVPVDLEVLLDPPLAEAAEDNTDSRKIS